MLRSTVLIFSITLLTQLLGCVHAAKPTDQDHPMEPGIRGTLTQNGQQRRYLLHLPTAYSQTDRPLPLIIALHGGGGNGAQFERSSRLSEKADQAGFIVVYPDGFANPGRLGISSWNAGACCGPNASDQLTDDVGFIRELIKKLSTEYRIDTKRVYATGHSNGAMLCYRLACELSDKIAAIAPNAGTFQLKTACRPGRAVPILHIHSKQDQHVPYLGGVGASSLNKQWNPPVDSTLAIFAGLDGCPPSRQLTHQETNYAVYEWAPCQNGAVIRYYLTNDGGHSWPGGRTGVLGDAPSEAFTNNDLIWDFFKMYSLP